MDWYDALTDQLLKSMNEDNIANEQNIANGAESPESIWKRLEQRVVELYKAILLYQMKSVCSYYRNQYKELFLNLVDLKNWDGARTNVVSAENTLKDDWEQYRNMKAMNHLGKLVELTEESQSLLGDIGETLRDVIAQQKEMGGDEKKKNCLRDLRVINPQDDMNGILEEKEAV
jgi:hypothetical protein